MADDFRSAHPGRCVARFGRAPRTELHPEPQGRSFPFAPEHMDLVLHELLMNASKATLRHHALREVRVRVEG